MAKFKTLDEFLNLFPDKPRQRIEGGYNVLCPAHADRNPSLSIVEKGGRFLLYCQAGCPTEKVVASLGLEMAELFTKTTEKKIVATYDYKDENNNFLFQVVRYEPKSFAQRHRNGKGDWVWNLTGVRRVLYHLPEIIQEPGTIYFTEGEQDADCLWEWGQVATTSPGGANSWNPEYANYLIGKRVVLIPDKDKAGYDYARSIIKTLQNKAREIKCIILPDDNVKDISDWIAAGNDIQGLPSLEQDVSVLLDPERPHYQQEEDSIIWRKNIKGQYIVFKAQNLRSEKSGIHARVSIFCDYSPLAWSLFNIERSEDRVRLSNLAYSQLQTETYSKEDMRRDLDIFCAGLWDFTLALHIPELTYGDETLKPIRFLLKPYIVESGGTILFAPAGRGKSNTALIWAVSINTGTNKYWVVEKTPTLFINLERSKESVRRRLALVNKVLGLPVNKPLLILNARGKSLSEIMPACQKTIKKYNIGFIVLDSISRAGYGDLTENRPVNAIIDSLSSLCDSWLALAHTPRSDETHIFGGVHFEAGADIVIQLSSEITKAGTLGLGFEITKSNDTPRAPQSIWAMEFDEQGLTELRHGKSNEFLEIEGKSKRSMLDTVTDWLQDRDSGDATATEIADELGYNRVNISSMLNKSEQFIKTRNIGRKQYYGVKFSLL